MKQLRMGLKIAAAVISLLPGVAVFAGDVKVEDVSAVDPAAHRVTMHASNVTAQEAIDQFAKASGLSIDLLPEQGQMLSPAPVTYYDIDIADLPIESALDHLGKTINRRMEMQENGGQVRAEPYNPAGYDDPYSRGSSSDVPLAVTAQSVSRIANFPARPGAQPMLQIQFRVEGGGGRKVLGQPTVVVEQATDDQNNVLPPAKADNFSYQQVMSIMQQPPVARLKCPDPTPKKIASVKGTVEWRVPATFSQITVTNLHDGKPSKGDLNGCDIEVAPPHENGANWEIDLKIHRGSSMPVKTWNSSRDTFMSSFMQGHVIGVDGKGYQNRGGSGGGGGRDDVSLTLFIARDSNSGGDSKVMPDTLVWRIVKDTAPLKVSFQASDLAVP